MTATGALPDALAAAGVGKGVPLALAVLPGTGLALAWAGGERLVPTADPAGAVRGLAALDPRWTWWSARQAAAPLVAAGVRLRACWDLAAVGRLAYGLRRGDPAAVWAAAHGLPEPPVRRGEPDLFDAFDASADGGEPVRADGQLNPEWAAGGWSADLAAAARWARLALQVRDRQEALLRTVADPRPAGGPPLALLTAFAESAAALLALELEHDGLPLDRGVAAALLGRIVGERPADAAAEAAQRRARDERVLARFPGPPVDLRSPQQVRVLLARVGLDLPDTRSWRLEPHASGASPVAEAVAALLAWRKAERIATTYGWAWLDANVGADGRLRGSWGAADAAAGRMTAGAGLHNMPAELRAVVRAEPGRVLVRADLGQVEPRVLATVSGDSSLARAAREDDMYAPVAAHLGCDRPTAKVAVLAAMYGGTAGAAAAALRDMDRAYPRAMAYLRAAEDAGRDGVDLRTYGGRLLPLSRRATRAAAGEAVAPPHAYGRFARNAVVQGAAAELFKAWAATVRAGLPALHGEIVLCLHDELLLHVPAGQADAAAGLLRSALESTARWWAAGSGVRFVAEVSAGPGWHDDG